jgi:hypothetical protein
LSQPSSPTNPLHINITVSQNPIFIINSIPISPTAGEATLACTRLDLYNNHQASSRVCNGSSLFHIQSHLSHHCDLTRLAAIISTLRNSSPTNPRNIQLLARFLSSAGDAFSFNTTPSDPLTSLNNQQLNIALLQRLLEPIIPTTYIKNNCTVHATFTCPKCNKSSVPLSSSEDLSGPNDIDPYGFHAFRCQADGQAPRTKLLHDKLRDAWLRCLKSAGFDAKKEPYNEMVNSNKRADIGVLLDDKLCNLYLDVRTCDPLLKSCVSVCSRHAGQAANLGVVEKNKAWLQLSHDQGDQFQALCHEHPGHIGEGALAILGRAASRFATTIPQQNAFRTFWLQRLHLTNTRGTADLTLSRMPFSEIDSVLPDSYHNPFPSLPLAHPNPQPIAPCLPITTTNALILPNETETIFEPDSVHCL